MSEVKNCGDVLAEVFNIPDEDKDYMQKYIEERVELLDDDRVISLLNLYLEMGVSKGTDPVICAFLFGMGCGRLYQRYRDV